MITTATLWVCSNCGTVSHLEGTVQPQVHIISYCPGTAEPGGKHSFKPVLVVVPYA